MRMRALRTAAAEEFGAAHAGVLFRDYWVTNLAGTPDEALARGVEPRAVWVALCEEFDVPESRRHGRGLADPRKD
ncbi:DUF3046 domain-containing protein [Leucobacter sp. cx-42]|nr:MULTISPECIES: DUF3046 domain-containing protein [unclassified Leucobacter]MBC9954245.1 DUF3046 domain-containing protein [Leucobacter sp. cx-42]